MKHFRKTRIGLVLLALVIALLSPLSVQAASAKAKAVKAYSNMLSKKTMRWGKSTIYRAVPTKNCRFAIVYIDGDSVPELIVWNGISGDVDHATGYGVLYTYRNNKVQVVENLRLEGFSYYKKRGVYIDTGIYWGTEANFYKKLVKGKAAALAGCDRDLNNPQATYRYYNHKTNKRITKSSFYTILKKQVGTQKKSKASFHKNTVSNRMKYLK